MVEDVLNAAVALFLRGDSPSHLSKIDLLGADALVVDLEDAVAATAKDGARRLVREHLQHRVPGRALWVRVGALADGALDADLEAALWPAVSAVVLPKVVGRADLEALDEALSDWEGRRGTAAGSTGVVALVETAAGVAGLASTLAGPRTRALRLALGPADYAADLGVANEPGSPAIEHARACLVLHSAAAGLPAPLDGPWMLIDDADGLAQDSARSRAHGFGGRLAIHPGQVEVAAAAYGAPPGLERARAVVAAWEGRPAGVGALRVGDEFVDPPVYAAAVRLLGGAR